MLSEVQEKSPVYALLSVSDKHHIVPLARALLGAGYTLLSTGGTAHLLRDAALEVTDVSSLTGFPELLDGRVKTLHPLIHGALLANLDDPDHRHTLIAHDIPRIAILVVNLYPFANTISRPGVSHDEAIAQIDIGGPTMLRAAAKNCAHVLPVCAPEDYPWLIEALDTGREIHPHERLRLAQKVFAHTASYDALIARYMRSHLPPPEQGAPTVLPELLLEPLQQSMTLRYGENPHQHAALYHEPTSSPLHGFTHIHGKSLSYNNLIDLDAALALVHEFDDPTCAIIKHTNPAGCASALDLHTAYTRALASDPTSAFGGIVALNRDVDATLAASLHLHFFEVIAAPSFSTAALNVLTQKKNLRLIVTPPIIPMPHLLVRHTSFGVLAQSHDPRITLDLTTCEVPTARAPSPHEWLELAFAWRVVKHVKSNAIVLSSDRATVGVGAGQMSRVDAVQLAISRSLSPLAGSVLASDAFFPFADGPLAAIRAGITAIVQPGGSIRDEEVIAACDAHDIAMVCTGMRHFRHG